MKKNYSINVPVGIFWKFVVPAIVVVAVIGSIVGILVVDKIVMPGIVHTDRQVVTIPSLVNKPWEQARQSLFDIGLRLQIKERQYDEKMPNNFILSQQPAANEKVKKGRMVVVTVSKGSEIGVVPDVRKITERKAVTELRKQGFIIGKKRHDFSDSLDKDLVISISPAANTRISREMPLELLISDGVKPTHADVPNVIGESLLSAKKKIEDAGLTLGKIEYKNNSTLSPGTIVSQSVPPGSSIPLQATINIVVSVIN